MSLVSQVCLCRLHWFQKGYICFSQSLHYLIFVVVTFESSLYLVWLIANPLIFYTMNMFGDPRLHLCLLSWFIVTSGGPTSYWTLMQLLWCLISLLYFVKVHSPLTILPIICSQVVSIHYTHFSLFSSMSLRVWCLSEVWMETSHVWWIVCFSKHWYLESCSFTS